MAGESLRGSARRHTASNERRRWKPKRHGHALLRSLRPVICARFANGLGSSREPSRELCELARLGRRACAAWRPAGCSNRRLRSSGRRSSSGDRGRSVQGKPAGRRRCTSVTALVCISCPHPCWSSLKILTEESRKQVSGARISSVGKHAWRQDRMGRLTQRATQLMRGHDPARVRL